MKGHVDDGLGERKKKEKRGFKVDRSSRYLEKHRKEMESLTGKKAPKAKEQGTTVRPKELKFDPEARQQYLLTLHKKKNERRVTAMVENRRRIAKENNRFRRESREEARRQYNEYAKVPILPDYTFKLPNPLAEENASEDANSDDEDEMVDGVQLASEVAAVFESQHAADPLAMTGMSLHSSREGAVTVDVQPLFGRHANSDPSTLATASGKKNKFAGGLDFSDLPSDVADKLKHLMAERKGPSKMKPRVHLVKEMQKFHKIQKHSRKKKK